MIIVAKEAVKSEETNHHCRCYCRADVASSEENTGH